MAEVSKNAGRRSLALYTLSANGHRNIEIGGNAIVQMNEVVVTKPQVSFQVISECGCFVRERDVLTNFGT